MRRTILLLATMALGLLLASGVALAAIVDCTSGIQCNGTPDPDTINGSADPDQMYGLAGADTMEGNDGADYLQGDQGADTLGGGNDADELWAGADLGDPSGLDKSDDVVHGGLGEDYIWAGFARRGVDRVYGEGGNDTIEAQQAYGFPKTKDVVNCGTGKDDTVYFDSGLDRVKDNCENKFPDQTPP